MIREIPDELLTRLLRRGVFTHALPRGRSMCRRGQSPERISSGVLLSRDVYRIIRITSRIMRRVTTLIVIV
jgi:hypothetical protein